MYLTAIRMHRIKFEQKRKWYLKKVVKWFLTKTVNKDNQNNFIECNLSPTKTRVYRIFGKSSEYQCLYPKLHEDIDNNGISITPQNNIFSQETQEKYDVIVTTTFSV